MTKRSTKNALLSSVVALLLCCSMLVGTTFAWFTDSATSANNVIVAGNLDIDLKYWDGDSWETVDGADKILDPDALWEPGYTEVVYLKLENKGSLALKYQLGVNIVSETKGINVAGEGFKLSEYIYFDVIEGVDGEMSPYADRAAAQAAATTPEKIAAGFTTADSLAAKADPVYLAMVVYLPASVGNAANHNGEDVPEINLGINVRATQMTAEDDSFDNQYDADAVYADHYVRTSDELTAVINAAKPDEVIALYAGDYTLPMNDTWWKATDLAANVTLLGVEDGVRITPVSNGSTGVGEQGRIQAEGYTFENITFTNTVSPSGYGKFVNCTFEGYNGLRHGAYKQDTYFTNCVFNNADGWAFHTEYLYDANVYFNGCSFNGLVEYTDTIATADKVYFERCAFLGSNRTTSGKIFYAWKNNAIITDCAGYDANTFAGATVNGEALTFAKDSAALKAAINGGAKDILAIDASFDEKLSLGSDVTATFIGCSFTGNNAWGYVENATFENCTFDSTEAAIHFDRLYGELLVKNCTFVAGKIQIGTDGSSSARFEGCDFGATEQTSIWSEKGIRVYCETTFADCEFNNRVVMAGSNDLPITFDGCTMEGGKPVYYVDNTDGIIRGGNIPAVTVK